MQYQQQYTWNNSFSDSYSNIYNFLKLNLERFWKFSKYFLNAQISKSLLGMFNNFFNTVLGQFFAQILYAFVFCINLPLFFFKFLSGKYWDMFELFFFNFLCFYVFFLFYVKIFNQCKYKTNVCWVRLCTYIAIIYRYG